MENYEKKYKNALEWARQVMNGETGFIRKEVEEVFPELAESEDDIEYTRTDAFIEKVCEWLKTNYTEFLDSSRLGINIEKLVKDLKNDFRIDNPYK